VLGMNKWVLMTIIFISIIIIFGTFQESQSAPATGIVKSFQKISDTTGNFLNVLDDGDRFSHVIASIGDRDGDGVIDIAVGADFDDDGCLPNNSDCDKGAVYILFMNNDGTVKSHQKISDTEGGV